MRLRNSLFFTLFISYSVQGIDPSIFHGAEYAQFSSEKISKVFGQGNKKFSLVKRGNNGIIFYVQDIDSVEVEGNDISSLYQGLDCEHKIGYEMLIEKRNAGPVTVALCKNDNPLLQKRIFNAPPLLKSPSIERIKKYSQKRDTLSGVYVFSVILVGHGIFEILTVVSYSNDSNYVSVVQMMPDDWVCRENSGEDTALCKDLSELAIELGSNLQE